MSELDNELCGILSVAGGGVIDLSRSAAQRLEVQGFLIVRIEPDVGSTYNRNVFALHRGKILWQIEESPHGADKDKPFTSISLGMGGEVIAGNWNGVDYSVDISSGTIKVKNFRK